MLGYRSFAILRARAPGQRRRGALHPDVEGEPIVGAKPPGLAFSFTAQSTPRRLRGALLCIVGVALVAIHRGVVFADQTVHHLRIVNVAARAEHYATVNREDLAKGG